MMSMNCRPPLAMATTKAATLPAVNALIRNKLSSNIGSAMLLSITTNAANSKAPPTSSPRTAGFVQPMA